MDRHHSPEQVAGTRVVRRITERVVIISILPFSETSASDLQFAEDGGAQNVMHRQESQDFGQKQQRNAVCEVRPHRNKRIEADHDWMVLSDNLVEGHAVQVDDTFLLASAEADENANEHQEPQLLHSGRKRPRP